MITEKHKKDCKCWKENDGHVIIVNMKYVVKNDMIIMTETATNFELIQRRKGRVCN